MFRRILTLLSLCACAVLAAITSGCGGSASNGMGGSSVIGGSPGNASPGCGGFESGYTNQNGLGVWVQTPAPGETPSNVTVNATAYDSVPIKQWTVCLDGQAAYQANSAATTISQPITIPNGQHLLWASATDSNGNYNRSEIRLVEVGPPPPSSTTIPTPPASATVMTEMQNDKATWSICSQCAAGTNVTNNYTLTFDQSNPSLSGSSLEMYAGGPRWSNVLFKDILMGTTQKTHFLWDFWVYHDPAVENHFWSSEMDFYVVLSGQEFMIGSQCDFGDGYWSTWDSNGNRWVLNGIPCPHWTPGWHHVQEYDELINNDTQYRYDTLVFDGKAYGLNQTWNTNSTAWQDQIGLQFQLDQDPSGTPLHEWADKVTLTMW